MKATKKAMIALAMAGALTGGAWAQPQPGSPGAGMGPGMMGGYGPGGPGGRGGYGPGYGMGPGTMGESGPGYGMGPGMMGGYGPGYGAGPGTMGPLNMLALDDAQRGKVNKIDDELRHKTWDLVGKMQDEQAKLRDLYLAEPRDRTAILAAYKRLFDLRLQRIGAMLDARAQLDDVLTKEQQDALRRFAPGWMM